MKALGLHFIIGLLTVAIAVPAFADEQDMYAAGKKRKPASAKQPVKVEEPAAPCETDKPRTPSSVNENTKAEVRSPSNEKEWEASVSLLGGYAVTSTSDTATQNMRDQAHYNRNGYGGISLDSRFKTYAGLELEGYFGSGSSSTTTEVNKITGAISNNTRKLGQGGFMGALKGQVPIQLSRWTIFPKAGIGYGALSAKETITSPAGTETENKETVKAPYFLVGLDTEVYENVLFGVDFAGSLGGSGTLTTGATDTDTSSANFFRFRVGAYYRFLPSFTAGLQYNRRQLKYTAVATNASPAPAETSEGFDQYLGVVSVSF